MTARSLAAAEARQRRQAGGLAAGADRGGVLPQASSRPTASERAALRQARLKRWQEVR